jgi:hypothetical protein
MTTFFFLAQGGSQSQRPDHDCHGDFLEHVLHRSASFPSP